jgi:HAD superfamily hydrolase (TIGR01484 family)
MRFLALAVDYDGTLARDGRVQPSTVQALEKVAASGRRLVLVTGRRLPELERDFDRIDLFDRVVAENGGLLYRPSPKEERPLAEAPSERFVERLRGERIEPLGVGRAIVATWEPHEGAVLAAIRDLGLELQVIFNKGAVMVLPAGVNKATGLDHALDELRLSRHNTVGIGDAENDHAFLERCEVSAAVANALPLLKERADIVTQGDHGAGVEEIAERLVADDLAGEARDLPRQLVPLGSLDGDPVQVPAYGPSLLVAGPSGSGKSSLVNGFLERLLDRGYQVCLVDPEGDYETVGTAVALGDPKHPAVIGEVVDLLQRPERSAIVNLLGIELPDRPAFFAELLGRLVELRATLGRPHWIVVDEAHHLLPHAWQPVSEAVPRHLHSTVLITVHPERLSPVILESVTDAIAVGDEVGDTLAAMAGPWDANPPSGTPRTVEHGQAIRWRRGAGAIERFGILEARLDQRRHRRKYAYGDLPDERSFYFRGPEGRLKLRASNLVTFSELADGVDDETWLFHLRRGDYSRWIRAIVKDDDLAEAVAAIERDDGSSARGSRDRVREELSSRYTAPV